MLSEKLKTRVEVAHLRIDFLNHVLLQGLFIGDRANDTLLYAGEAQVRIDDWFIFRDKTVLHYLALQNTKVHFYRSDTSATWNFDFIVDALSSKKKKPTSKSKPFEFDIQKVELENVSFHLDDKWGGEDEHYDIGKLSLNAKGLDFRKKLIDISDITVANADVTLNEYKPGHPSPKNRAKVNIIDSTPFNPEKWMVKAGSLSLSGCSLHLTMDRKVPVPGLFDENHLVIKGIDVAANTINIVGDTIRGNVTNLTAFERSGIAIKRMRSKVTVSPIASICEDLALETNYSKLGNYYAMHYKRFPDFPDFIKSVVMVGHLKDAVVDMRDIAYFAPQLKSFPPVVFRVSGDGKGTVDNISAHNINVSDGKTVLKGALTMKGLPDIYTTYITYTNGELFTTGEGILHYFSGLRNSPDVAIEKIKYAYFRGGYSGYIENFGVVGKLNTNLGAVDLNVKMNIPGFKAENAVYTGTLSSDKADLGIFLKQPLLGSISLNEKISGSSFDASKAQMNIDGTISELVLNGYAYHGLITHGVLAKKEFNGSLLVDDPNLALEFNGFINYSNKNVNVKATAHLLGSNFKALNLTSDSVTASADFDLDCTGSNIDNFSGYAKLNNIDMKRKGHKLDLDSVLISSTGDSTRRLLNIQSNAVVARIQGAYQLSKLPASIQYYLSRYLPNYIKTPDKYAPDQNFEFTVSTKIVDSIFAVTLPFIRGFDSALVSGSLNTSAQKLTLNANIPFGSIGVVHMVNIAVNGQGNLDRLALNTTIDNVAIGDSVLNGSLSVTTTVGNDSVGFTIATTSPSISSALTLNGNIIARRDTLFLNLLPSQFFLNQAKWDIAGGSKVIYSDKYLLVQGLTLSSGLQKISAATEVQDKDKMILIATENVDLGQLGVWAGLSSYQPDGRLNGTVKIERIFKDLFVSADLKATGVNFGLDTVGTINVVGTYDGAKKLVSFDPHTGVFRGDGSVIASGNISFDSSTNQKLNGVVQFINTPVAWSTPFLAGFLSRLTGTVSGSVTFDGSSYAPIINGDLALYNSTFHLDYMGCNYSVPSAVAHIDNHRISFGKTQIFDVYKNYATLTGYFSHNLFKDMRMRLTLKSNKFEVLNLNSSENSVFYGNVIASVDSFTVRGPFNNIRLSAFNATPAAESRIYIPVSTGGDVGTYSYVSFKTYGKNQDKVPRKIKDKMDIRIDANLNTLAEIHIVLDPAAGDEIMARGDGNVQFEMPPDNDIHMAGLYSIDNGTYSFSFQQFIRRHFNLTSGSTISFNGPFAETNLNVNAIYSTKARLLDLLTEADKASSTASDLTDAQTPQMVDVLLHMNGTIFSPKLTFDLDLEDKHSQSTIAYRKLTLINYDERQKFDQVASLLLINSFIPPEGVGSAVTSGAINNFSQIVSSTASTGLTSILNKITGDKQLNIAVKYQNYNYSDQAVGGVSNRNQFKFDVSKNYFNNRLILEGGATSDWGRQAASPTNATNFNFTGDFRVQYQIRQGSGLRLNCFRTSDYDVTLDKPIARSGVGITWRKSFDGFADFFRSNDYVAKQKAKREQRVPGEQ